MAEGIAQTLLQAYDSVFKGTTAKLAVSSLIISALFTGVVWILFAGSVTFGGKEWEGVINQLGVGTAIAISGLFTITFFVVWFILYIGNIKESEDIYSHVRKKVEGAWLAEYDYLVGGQKVFSSKPMGAFKFLINQEKKIEMSFDPRDTKAFSDKDQAIKNIALRQGDDRKVYLTYYYKN